MVSWWRKTGILPDVGSGSGQVADTDLNEILDEQGLLKTQDIIDGRWIHMMRNVYKQVRNLSVSYIGGGSRGWAW